MSDSLSNNTKIIDMGQLIKFVGGGERAYIEGELVLNANHLMLCGYLQKSNTNLEIFALCLQSSALKDNPHEIKLTIDKVSKKICGRCSCKAGVAAKCKRGVAVLLYLNRFELYIFESLMYYFLIL